MRVRTQLLLMIGAIGTLIFLTLVGRYINRPRIIVSAMAPDGTEMCIVQQCNWSAEIFTTSFVYRKPGKPWGWFYYDHQDWYWGSGRFVVDTNLTTAVFYRDDKVTVEFDWTTETYHLRPKRTLTGAQRWLPAGWSPSMSIYK